MHSEISYQQDMAQGHLIICSKRSNLEMQKKIKRA